MQLHSWTRNLAPTLSNWWKYYCGISECSSKSVFFQVYFVSSKNICDFLISSFLLLFAWTTTEYIWVHRYKQNTWRWFPPPTYMWLHPFFLLFENRMQTSRRWFLINPFCYPQWEKNLILWDKLGYVKVSGNLFFFFFCIKLQNPAGRVRWGGAKDRTSPSLWVTPGMKPGLHRFHDNDAVGFWTYCTERSFTLLRPWSSWWSECE